MKTGHLALAALLALSASAIATVAQDATQQDSLAAASRRAREAKKTQPAATKVFTNDNLPTNGAVSVVGQPTSASAAEASANAASAPGGTANQPPSASSSATKAADSAALENAKAELTSAKKDLDVVQRKFALDQQSYLSNPNHDADTAGAASLQTQQDQISAKQDEVDAAQKVVDDLQAKAGASTPAEQDSSSPSETPAAPTGSSGASH
jgi:hypothetical protein